MNEEPLSQAESKFVAYYLREKYRIPVKNALIFWRKTPSIAAEWIKAGWQKPVTGDEIAKAAGRSVN